MDQNTEKVSEAFSRQSEVFDDLYEENKLSEYLRARFREEILSQLKPGAAILELNCGTGMDALFFAEKGFKILATDNAPGMLEKLDQKIAFKNMKEEITTLRCSFNDIRTIQNKKFDHIISNFGGLNCTNRLDQVLEQFSELLNPGGKATLMIMPRVCPWELLMLFKGDFKTAFRRFKKGTPAHIEGTHFLCYYYNPAYITKVLQTDFKRKTLKGVFITVPPEFYANFVERYPKLFSFLRKIDAAICGWFPFTYCCDHYIITLEKKL